MSDLTIRLSSMRNLESTVFQKGDLGKSFENIVRVDQESERFRPVGIHRRPQGFALTVGWSGTRPKEDPDVFAEEIFNFVHGPRLAAPPWPFAPCFVMLAEWDPTMRVVAYRSEFGRVPAFLLKNNDALTLSTHPAKALELAGANAQPNLKRLRQFLMGANGLSDFSFMRGLERLLPGVVYSWNSKMSLSRKAQESLSASNLPKSRQGRVSRLGQEFSKAISSFESRWDSRPCYWVSGGLDSTILYSKAVDENGTSDLFGARMKSERHQIFEPRDRLDSVEKMHGTQICDFCIDEGRLVETDARASVAWGPSDYPGQRFLSSFVKRIVRKTGKRVFATGNGSERLFTRRAGETLNTISSAELVRGAFEFSRAFGKKRFLHALVDKLLMGYFGGSGSDIRRDSGVDNEELPIWRKPIYWVRRPLRSSMKPVDSRQLNFVDNPFSHFQSLYWGNVLRTYEKLSRERGVFFEFPYLERSLARFVLSLPHSDLVADGKNRWPLRVLGRRLLPSEFFPFRKSGWVDQLLEWKLGVEETRIVVELFEQSILEEFGLIESSKFLQAYEKYCAASRENIGSGEIVGSFPIWRAISAELWLRRFRGC